MKMPVGVSGQPVAHLWRLVDAEVIQDHMDFSAFPVLASKQVQEVDKIVLIA